MSGGTTGSAHYVLMHHLIQRQLRKWKNCALNIAGGEQDSFYCVWCSEFLELSAFLAIIVTIDGEAVAALRKATPWCKSGVRHSEQFQSISSPGRQQQSTGVTEEKKEESLWQSHAMLKGVLLCHCLAGKQNFPSPRHEGMRWKQRYGSSHSWPGR